VSAPCESSWSDAVRALLIVMLLASLTLCADDLVSDTAAVRVILDSAGADTIAALRTADTANGRITRLYLNLGMASLPAQIGALTALQFLDISYNRLTSLPSQLARCTSLVIIQLQYNNFASMPAVLLDMPRVQQLRFTFNQIRTLPDGIAAMAACTLLFVDENQLDSIPASICRARTLRELNVRINNLVSLPDSIGFMDSLKVLTLTGNQLTKLPESITRLPKLAIFDSGSNHLCDVDSAVSQWLDMQEPPWRSRQICTGNVASGIRGRNEDALAGGGRYQLRIALERPRLSVARAVVLLNGKSCAVEPDVFAAPPCR
jgi:Leucine-rich repeat (LRR) protein